MKVDPRRLCQIEIRTSDIEKSLQFYEKVFSWKRVPAEIHNYIVLEVPDNCPFGITLVPKKVGGSSGKQVTIYFEVDDPEAIYELAPKWGGRQRFGPKKVASYGRIWQITDPDGQRFGLFKPV